MSSTYYSNLDEESKKRYISKLTIAGERLPDPLDEDLRKLLFQLNKYTMWPKVSFGDVYMYLVVKKCFYTNEAFENYKALDCYNFLLSGKVHDVKVYRCESIKICIMTCSVQASQTSTKFPMPWAVIECSGKIISGHCTCMAGLGEACSHVSALLLTVETAVREGFTNPSCTSMPCLWKKVSKKAEHVFASEINFSHQKTKTECTSISSSLPSAEAYTSFLDIVKKHQSDAPIFTLLTDSEDTDSASEVEDDIPNIIEIIRRINETIPLHFSNEKRLSIILKKLDGTLFDTESIEEQTQGGEKNCKWMKQRKGKITASLFHRVICCKKGHKGLISTIMQYNSPVTAESLRWGLDNEKYAISSVMEKMQQEHFQFTKCGLKIDKIFPFLAASPDGLDKCDCCENAVVEIKCPFSLQNHTIEHKNIKKNFL